MRLAKVLPYFFAAACAANSSRPRQVRENVYTYSTPDYTITHYQTIRGAMEALLTTTNPRVLAVGEKHNSGTLSIFAVHILPLLRNYGISDIIWEHLPDNPQTEIEAAAFNRTTTDNLGPFFNRWFGPTVPDLSGIHLMFQQTRIYGLRLHGAHLPDNATLRRMPIPAMGPLITANFLRQIMVHIARGTRIATFSGAIHNNRAVVNQGEMNNIFGNVVAAQLGTGYVELDIIVANGGEVLYDNRFGVYDVETLIPQRGANLLAYRNSAEEGGYLLLVPASVVPRQRSR